MRSKTQHSNFLRNIALSLILPVVFITFFSFQRSTHAEVIVKIVAVVIFPPILIIDALTCDVNVVFFGCGGDGGPSSPAPAPTCSNGANNPTACNQCSDGSAYIGSSCVACGNGGCTGAGGRYLNFMTHFLCSHHPYKKSPSHLNSLLIICPEKITPPG